MWIKQINLGNFRNYLTQTLDLNPSFNVFVGDNAQGKTNLLESMYLLALSKSYRTTRESEMIHHETPTARVHGRVAREADVDLEVLVQRDGPKKLLVNGKSTTASNFVGKLNVVLFTPDSLQLVKGSPGDRRRFLDIQICQTDPVYSKTLLKYQRIIRQRNQILKDGAINRRALSQLPIWDHQLIDLGSKIMARRSRVLQVINVLSQEMHRNITAGVEDLKVVYFPFFLKDDIVSENSVYTVNDLVERLSEEIERKRSEEIKRGFTLVGPHRDDIVFLVNGTNSRIFGSQGQQRTAVLSYKLAEMQFLKDESDQYPVVLLDDVMSELDHERRQFLLSILNKRAQTIITTTHLGSFSEDILNSAMVFRIQSGRIV